MNRSASATSFWGGAGLPSLSMLFFLLVLLGVGVLFIHSASTAGDEPFPGRLAKLQLIRIAVGGLGLMMFLRLDYRKLELLAGPLFLCGLVLLLILIGLKPFRDGPSRWFYLPGFALQPSEMMKLYSVLILARILKASYNAGPGPDWGPALITIAIPTVLIAMQPDLGTALVLPPIFASMYWVAGGQARVLGRLTILATLLVPLGWFVLQDYQKERILVFLDPDNPTYARDDGYQIRQSLIAIGNGGIEGRGLYEGTQNRLNYLPEDHNDFIFAIIGEEWGLIGTLSVCGLFLCLFLSAAGIAYRTREPFGRLVAIGMTTHLAFQTTINLAMTMGLAPVTGLPLPFMSYGGSSLFSSLAAIGIVLGIGMRPVRIIDPDGLRAGSSPILTGGGLNR